MKRTFSLLAATIAAGLLLSTSTDVLGFGGPPGGPFSNGSYFPNDGTFSAVVRGENLTGTLQFSTTSGAGPDAVGGTGGLGSTGVATVYFDGDTYQGNSQGSLNSQSSTMIVNFQADVEGQGQQQFDTSTIVDLGDLITITTTVNPDGTVVTEETVTPQREITTGSTITYFDSLYLNGFANCKTSNAFPNQKFEGDGEAEFQHLIFVGNTPLLDAVPIPISVTGVRLSNTATSFNVSEVRPPSYNEFTVIAP